VTLAHIQALPHYLGGKREIAPTIFRCIAEAGFPPARGHVLVDAFQGGGSIALTGKALGYRVHANDTSIRSEAVGRGLLENDRVKLSLADIELALEHEPGWMPSTREFPFTDAARDLFARLAAAAAEHPDPRKGALLRLAVFKTAQRIAPYSQPNAAGTAAAAIRARGYDKLTEYDRKFHVPRFTRPRAFLEQSVAELEAGVFPNGERNSFSRADALDFIAGQAGDVLYLDPPYPGTKVYETHFEALDSVLAGKPIEVHPSRFSAKDGWRHIEALLDAAEPYPLWVISLGSASAGLDELDGMLVARGRTPEVRSVKHMHLKGTASAEHRASNEEVVITAASSRPTKED
jgi:hypothetical protein